MMTLVLFTVSLVENMCLLNTVLTAWARQCAGPGDRIVNQRGQAPALPQLGAHMTDHKQAHTSPI